MPEESEERDPQTYAIIGCAMEVHRVLGCGFLEAVYQEALSLELAARNLPFSSEVALPIAYKGTMLACGYRADFVCYGEVIVEVKALDKLLGTHQSQVINYLRATGFKRALLLNFGTARLEFTRIVL